MDLIDLSEDDIIEACRYIGMTTKGIFSYQDIRRMSYKRFKNLTESSEKLFNQLYVKEEN